MTLIMSVCGQIANGVVVSGDDYCLSDDNNNKVNDPVRMCLGHTDRQTDRTKWGRQKKWRPPQAVVRGTTTTFCFGKKFSIAQNLQIWKIIDQFQT